ncbi:Granulin family protein [Acanthocheilonema viteae]
MILSFVFLLTIGTSVKVLIAHTCPGGKSICPDTATCCLIDVGTYGCCPIMDAVCCDDRTHCCPPDTKCDMVHRQCLRNEVSISRTNKRAKHLAEETNIIKNRKLMRICNGGNSSCATSHTWELSSFSL